MSVGLKLICIVSLTVSLSQWSVSSYKFLNITPKSFVINNHSMTHFSHRVTCDFQASLQSVRKIRPGNEFKRRRLL